MDLALLCQCGSCGVAEPFNSGRCFCPVDPSEGTSTSSMTALSFQIEPLDRPPVGAFVVVWPGPVTRRFNIRECDEPHQGNPCSDGWTHQGESRDSTIEVAATEVLPMRTTSSTSFSGWQLDDPTPEEIADACRLIQQHWSHREHYRRAGRRVPPWLAGEGGQQVGQDDAWTPPVVSLAGGIGEPWG